MTGTPGPMSPPPLHRMPGLDEWRGILVLIVVAAHFLTFKMADLFTGGYQVVEPLGPPGPGLLAGLMPGRQQADSLLVLGWAFDPASVDGPGVASVEVAFGDGPFRPAFLGLPTPGLAAENPARLRAGWSVSWPSPPTGESRVQVRLRAPDGRVFTRTGRLTWPGGKAPILWPAVAAQAAVDGFFVISGFLITLILIRTQGRPGFLRVFWARRALRILPLAWLMVAAAWFLSPATRSLLPAYAFFYANYLVEVVPGLAPMWSLAVEEQFYLVFPLLVALVPRHRLWVLVGGLVLAGTAARLLTVHFTVDGLYIAQPTTQLRAVALALGAWLAVVREGLAPRPRACAAVFAVWAFLLAVVPGTDTLFTIRGRLGLLDPVGLLGSLGVLAWLVAHPIPPHRVLRWVGVRCYGFYLLHVPLLILVQGWIPGAPTAVFLLAWFASLVVAAGLSFRFLERPFLALAPDYPRGEERVLAPAAV